MCAIAIVLRGLLKSRIDFTAGACVDDLDLQPDGASSHFYVCRRGLRMCSVGRIRKHGHASDGDRRGCRLGCERRTGTSGRNDHGDLAATGERRARDARRCRAMRC
jgi:hypothetical protein